MSYSVTFSLHYRPYLKWVLLYELLYTAVAAVSKTNIQILCYTYIVILIHYIRIRTATVWHAIEYARDRWVDYYNMLSSSSRDRVKTTTLRSHIFFGREKIRTEPVIIYYIVHIYIYEMNASIYYIFMRLIDSNVQNE